MRVAGCVAPWKSKIKIRGLNAWSFALMGICITPVMRSATQMTRARAMLAGDSHGAHGIQGCP